MTANAEARLAEEWLALRTTGPTGGSCGAITRPTTAGAPEVPVSTAGRLRSSEPFAVAPVRCDVYDADGDDPPARLIATRAWDEGHREGASTKGCSQPRQ